MTIVINRQNNITIIISFLFITMITIGDQSIIHQKNRSYYHEVSIFFIRVLSGQLSLGLLEGLFEGFFQSGVIDVVTIIK